MATNRKDGVFCHDPLHVVFHKETKRKQAVFVGLHKRQCFETSSKCVDACQALGIAGVNVGRRKARGTDGAESETRSQRIQRCASTETFVHGTAAVDTEFRMQQRIEATSDLTAIRTRRIGDHRRPNGFFFVSFRRFHVLGTKYFVRAMGYRKSLLGAERCCPHSTTHDTGSGRKSRPRQETTTRVRIRPYGFLSEITRYKM